MIKRSFLHGFVVLLALMPWLGLIPLYALWFQAFGHVQHCFLAYGVHASMHDPKFYDAYPIVLGCVLFALMMCPFSVFSSGRLFFLFRSSTGSKRRTEFLILSVALLGLVLGASNVCYTGYDLQNPLAALMWFKD